MRFVALSDRCIFCISMVGYLDIYHSVVCTWGSLCVKKVSLGTIEEQHNNMSAAGQWNQSEIKRDDSVSSHLINQLCRHHTTTILLFKVQNSSLFEHYSQDKD